MPDTWRGAHRGGTTAAFTAHTRHRQQQHHSRTTPTAVMHTLTVDTERTHTGKRLKVCRCSCGWESPRAKTRHAVEAHAVREHPQAFCPTPNKKRHTTQRDAEMMLLEFWQTAKPGKKELRRAYECQCGRWHTTSQPEPALL